MLVKFWIWAAPFLIKEVLFHKLLCFLAPFTCVNPHCFLLQVPVYRGSFSESESYYWDTNHQIDGED